MNLHRIAKGFFYFGLLFIVIYLFSFGLSFLLVKGNKFSLKGKIGLIKIEGVLLSSDEIVRQIKSFSDDDSIDALIVRIDSPGGSVVPSQEIYQALLSFKKETNKKIVASLANIAASGGYYISCAADKIISNPGTMTGSIGVIMHFANLEGLFQKIGYEEKIIKAGKFKDIGSFSRPMSLDEERLLLDLVEDIHNQFIEAVSVSRHIEINQLKEIADGRIFSGRQAKALNLVDDLGSFDDAVLIAAKIANIKGTPKLIERKRERSLLNSVREILDEKSLIGAINILPYKIQYIMY